MRINGKLLSTPQPLRVGLYLRKSTEDREKDEELRSTGMQEASARRYAEKQGWVVLDEHVYRDDNVSGATLSRSEGLNPLKAALGLEDDKPLRRAPDPGSLPFDVLICRDQSRLYRRDDATKHIKRLLRTGVRIAY